MMRFGTFLAAAVGLAALSLASCEDKPAPAPAKPVAKTAANCPPVAEPTCPPAKATPVKAAKAKAQARRHHTRVQRSAQRRYVHRETGQGLAGGERYASYTEREYARPTGDYYRQDRSDESQASAGVYRRYEGSSQYVPPQRSESRGRTYTYQREERYEAPRQYVPPQRSYEGQGRAYTYQREERYEAPRQYAPPPPPPPRYDREQRRGGYAYEREESQSETRSERRYEEREESRSGGAYAESHSSRGCDCDGAGTARSFERYGTYSTAGRDQRGMLVWPGKTD